MKIYQEILNAAQSGSKEAEFLLQFMPKQTLESIDLQKAMRGGDKSIILIVSMKVKEEINHFILHEPNIGTFQKILREIIYSFDFEYEEPFGAWIKDFFFLHPTKDSNYLLSITDLRILKVKEDDFNKFTFALYDRNLSRKIPIISSDYYVFNPEENIIKYLKEKIESGGGTLTIEHTVI